MNLDVPTQFTLYGYSARDAHIFVGAHAVDSCGVLINKIIILSQVS